MKRFIIFISFILQSVCFLLAQTDIQSMYDNKVEETITLKQEISRLQKDSINLEARLRAKDEQNKELVEYKRKYDLLKNECDSLGKELKKRKEQESQIAIYKDSVLDLKEINIALNNKLDSLSKEHNLIVSLNNKYHPIYEKHEEFIKWLNVIYCSVTIDQLYNKSSKEQLLLSKELYEVLDKEVPLVILQTIECFEAKEQCSLKFSKALVTTKRTPLLKHNSKISKNLANLLEQYTYVYAEADSLWNVIKSEVCTEEIANESFPQIQSKRQIWQRTQKFLNKYPNLVNDYPYIYEELQKMLREIWKNANNFNKIANPFK